MPGKNVFSLSIEPNTLLGTKTKTTTTKPQESKFLKMFPKLCKLSPVNQIRTWMKIVRFRKNSHIHLVLVILELASVIREQ